MISSIIAKRKRIFSSRNSPALYTDQHSIRGFTIVELLIVIVVIGILAAISVVAYGGIQERARVAQANSDLVTLAKAINIARISQDKTLLAITGSNCTRCSTYTTYQLTLDRIGAASGSNLSSLKAGDPWGNLYAIDENEGEFVTCATDGFGVANSSAHSGLVIPLILTYNC